MFPEIKVAILICLAIVYISVLFHSGFFVNNFGIVWTLVIYCISLTPIAYWYFLACRYLYRKIG